MPKRYNTPHRSRVVKTRLSEGEYADFTARLASYDISQSEFRRQAIRRTTYTLKILLERSNFFLKQISSRYEFSCSMNSWAIMVVDKNMGGIERVASSLSGGETFIVSLALALGLAALNDTGFSVNMLFIDEGFGSLDYDSLDMVMGVLENLNRLGRQVGIISHVEMLRDRVPAKIQLVKKGNSSSVVSIVKS